MAVAVRNGPPPPGLAFLEPYPEVPVATLGLTGDAEVRRLLRKALRDAWPAARRFGWRISAVCELDPENQDVGYMGEDGTLCVKVRDPGAKGTKGLFYAYSFVLATMLHELTHLSILGHGKAFYTRLLEGLAHSGAEPSVRRESRAHICAELVNAVCENDARRAKALLAVLPEAAQCRLPGPDRQLPLEYAAHHGRVAITKLLLQARAEADVSPNGPSVPPLQRAEARGNRKTAQVLLNAGAMRLSNTPTIVQALQSHATGTTGSKNRSTSSGGSRSNSSSSNLHARANVGRGRGPKRSESVPTLPAVVPVSYAVLQQMTQTRGNRGAGVNASGRTGLWKGPCLCGSLAI